MYQESYRQTSVKAALRSCAGPVAAEALAAQLGQPVEFVQTTLRRFVRAGDATRHHHITGLTYSWNGEEGSRGRRHHCGRTLRAPRASSNCGRVLEALDTAQPQSARVLVDKLPDLSVRSIRNALCHLRTLGFAMPHRDYKENEGWVRPILQEAKPEPQPSRGSTVAKDC